MKRASIGVLLAALVLAVVWNRATAQAPGKPQLEKPSRVADGVWFERHHDVGAYGSNVSWIEFADFVVVIDTAFPRGAEQAVRGIRETVPGKPIRYAVVTHYHADHSFGTGVFAKEGATIVAHENARREYLARLPPDYAKRAATDPIAARYQAYAPNLAFTDKLIIDDGKKRRAEILFFGHAHTSGCIITWLPKEKIAFTGDATVNGNFNFLGDADTASWIEVIGRVQALGPTIVVPGHGPVGGPDVLDNQKQYFVELRRQVGALARQGKSVEDAQKLVDILQWKKWTGAPKMDGDAIAFVYQELKRRK